MSLYWVPEPGTYSNGSLARLRTVSLIEARTAPGGADDELDNAQGNYTAIGDSDRAERVQAARDAADKARSGLTTVIDAAEEALQHARDLPG